ncbi:hypothetical protein ACP3WY_25155 [Salmonella enterica]
MIADTIEPTPATKGCSRIRVVGVGELIGEAIRRIANEESISKLFD